MIDFGIPPASQRLYEAIRDEIANPTHADLADAALTTIFTEMRTLERVHPEYAEAFQALAEHFGYT